MSPAEPDRQFVEFALHGERYALPIAAVREIIRYTQPAATATAGDLVQGMIALRGRVLPVADLSAVLDRLLEIGPSTRILVVQLARGDLGLIVDNVTGVLTVPAERIAAVPVAVVHAGLGEEVATVDDRIIMLIDPEQALGGTLAPPRPARRRSTGTPSRTRRSTSP